MAEIDRREPLETVDAVRLRPAMYIGDVSSYGLHNMAFAVLDDCVSEVVNGNGTAVAVTLYPDGSIEFVDDGRPYPTTPLKPFNGLSNFEVAFQEIVIGAQHRGPRSWGAGHGGSHEIGLTPVNALSEWLHAESSDGCTATLTKYERGTCNSPMTKKPSDETGLRVRFRPDREIFRVTDFSAERIRSRLTDLAAIWPSLKLSLRDRRAESNDEIFDFADGVRSLVRIMNTDAPVRYERIFTVSQASEVFRIDVAFQHSNDASEKIRSFVNSIMTYEGGTHLTGFRSGLTRAVNAALKQQAIDRSITGNDLSRGLTAVISLWVDDPRFEGPTKT